MISNSPSISKTGINAGNQVISGVKAGTVGTDAVNVSQLDAVKDTANKGWKLTTSASTGTVAGSSVQKIAPDDTVTFTAGDNIAVEQAGSKITVSTKKDVSFDNVAVGSIKLDAATGKITGVTDGLVAVGSKEAVNGGQLHSTNQNVTMAKNAADAAQATADKGLNFAVNGVTPADNVKLGETVNFANGTNTTATYDAATNTYKYNLNDTVALSNAGSIVIKDSAGTGTVIAIDKMGVQSGNIKLDAATGKITGVTDGLVAVGSKEAVNGGQLYSVADSVKNVIGGNTTVDPNTGTLTTNNIGGTGKNNINDAIGSIKSTADQANKGWNISTNGDAASASNVKPSDTVDFSSTNSNLTVSNQGNNISVGLNKDIDLGKDGSLTIGDTKIDNSGLTIAGGPRVTTNGIDAGNKQVTNIADGKIAAGSQDAVNGSQIHDLMGSGAFDANGNISNIGGTGTSNINDAIASVNKNLNQSKTTVTQGSNIVVEKIDDPNGNGSEYKVSTAADININSITAKDVNAGTVNAEKFVAGNTTIDSNGLSIKSGPSVTTSGIDAGNKAVSNVSNGAQNSDAVNMGQLAQYLGGGAGYNNITQSFDAPNYQVNGGSYNNVGDALGALNQADQALGNRITNLGDQLQQAFYSTNQRIDDVEKRANAGIAAAMALENAPYIPGKYTYSAGAAYHGGENAIGVTLRKTADNGRWSLTGGVASGSSGAPSVRVGISGVID